jgi:hypothetical protein
MSVKSTGSLVSWGGTNIGNISDANGLYEALSKINIGTWEDDRIKTRPGRSSASQFTFNIMYSPDNTVQTTLETDRIAGTVKAVKVQAPSGTTKFINFSAAVLGFTWDGKDNDVFKGTITMQLTTAPVRATS